MIAELPTLPDPAGDSQKINQSGHAKLTTSLIGETFYQMCHVIVRISPIGEENLPD